MDNEWELILDKAFHRHLRASVLTADHGARCTRLFRSRPPSY